jgi:UDP-glucose 4-epimerase
MKIGILGAGGFIGTNLARRLVSDGHEVVSFVRGQVQKSENSFEERVSFDFRKLREISASLVGLDAVVHLVSSTSPASTELGARDDVTNNVIGSIELMEILRSNHRTRLIYISSGGAVYGTPKQSPIPESHSADPISHYGVGKLSIEKHLYVYGRESGLDYVILRLSNPYGPHQVTKRGQGIIPRIIGSAFSGNPLEVWGDGSNIRDFIYVDDALDAICKAIRYEGGSKVLNIGSGEGHSIIDLVSEVEGQLNLKIPIEFMPSRSLDAPKNVLDVSLAHSELDWWAKTHLGEGLRKTIEWNRFQPKNV